MLKMKNALTKTQYKITCIIAFIIDFIITGFTTSYIWNNIISVVFGVRTLSFWQAWLVSIAIIYFMPKRKKDKNEDEDYAIMLISDTIATVFVWFMCFIGLMFIKF